MQKIAKEINFSESIFIWQEEGQFHVRIFTPNEELSFAGHPLLGAAFYVNSNFNYQFPIEILTDSGLVTIDCDQDDVYWIKQKKPSFSSILEGAIIADLLSIDACEIDERYPIQVVSTDLPVIIVPIKKLSALKKVKIDHGIYYELIEELEAKGICVFSTETYSKRADINVRDFAPYYGIDEDAATGSSNGSILAYLKRYKVFQSKNLNLISEQGYEIKRPSTLYLRSIDKDMYVGGKIKKVAKGEWFLNNT